MTDEMKTHHGHTMALGDETRFGKTAALVKQDEPNSSSGGFIRSFFLGMTIVLSVASILLSVDTFQHLGKWPWPFSIVLNKNEQLIVHPIYGDPDDYRNYYQSMNRLCRDPKVNDGKEYPC